MSGRKRTPCEFCNGEYEGPYKEHRNGFTMWIEVYPFNQCISVLAQANTETGEMMEDYIDINMQFCPVCGRRLL